MAKKGRKKKGDLYFGPDEEKAVQEFISLGEMVPHPDHPEDKTRYIWVGTKEEEIERNAIYNKWLRKPLDKMVESIIRRYGLYRKNETYEDTHLTALSFLITKAHKFENSMGKKAYSYYGTICRNHLLGLIINDSKDQYRTLSYDDVVSELENSDDYKYELNEDQYDFDNLIKKIVESIENQIKNNDESFKNKLNENEIKVGYGLIEMLNDWETTLGSMEGGKKFNKNIFLENMRAYTNLTTKDIRVSMKKYKVLYNVIKLDTLENGSNE